MRHPAVKLSLRLQSRVTDHTRGPEASDCVLHRCLHLLASGAALSRLPGITFAVFAVAYPGTSWGGGGVQNPASLDLQRPKAGALLEGSGGMLPLKSFKIKHQMPHSGNSFCQKVNFDWKVCYCRLLFSAEKTEICTQVMILSSILGTDISHAVNVLWSPFLSF